MLSFLPAVMLAMVALFPSRQLGVELGSIVLIFTGQVWNIAFSFYSSLKTIPRDLREAAIIYRFSRWQRFLELDLPFSTIGLVWNSMMSVAGGWFFLMACEMFVLGTRTFACRGWAPICKPRPAAAIPARMLWGLATMVAVIVLMDQLLWRPVIAWADKFKFEQVESSATAQNSHSEFHPQRIVSDSRLPANSAPGGRLDDAAICERARSVRRIRLRHRQAASPRRWIGWVFCRAGGAA